jgi:hypothetical protein
VAEAGPEARIRVGDPVEVLVEEPAP